MHLRDRLGLEALADVQTGKCTREEAIAALLSATAMLIAAQIEPFRRTAVETCIRRLPQLVAAAERAIHQPSLS